MFAIHLLIHPLLQSFTLNTRLFKYSVSFTNSLTFYWFFHYNKLIPSFILINCSFLEYKSIFLNNSLNLSFKYKIIHFYSIVQQFHFFKFLQFSSVLFNILSFSLLQLPSVSFFSTIHCVVSSTLCFLFSQTFTVHGVSASSKISPTKNRF